MVLYTRVNDIITQSQPLINEALQDITAIKQTIATTLAASVQIQKGFAQLHIGPEKLDPGTAEISVLLPDELFDGSWDHFLKEGQLIDRLVKTASEIATGQAETPKVHQISSSDPTLFLLATPPTVLFVLKIVNMILEAYERVLKIRKAKAEAVVAEMPATVLKAYDEEAKKVIGAATDSFLANIKNNEFKSRKQTDQNHLISHMRDIAERIAARIDRGMRIEAAAEPPPPEDTEGDQEGEGADRSRQVFAEIEAASEKVRYLQTEGEPVLGLPSPNEEEGAEEDNDQRPSEEG